MPVAWGRLRRYLTPMVCPITQPAAVSLSPRENPDFALAGVSSATTGLRSYSAQFGRWVNRDPIEEKGGINLYVFSGNDALDQFDLIGLSWPNILLKCGLEAYKKVLGDQFSKKLKNLNLCKKIADHMAGNLNADACKKQHFLLEKAPLDYDVSNWAQVALNCILGAVKKAGGLDDFLDSIDDKSKKKLLEAIIGIGEGKISDLLEGGEKPEVKYGLTYQCDSPTSATCQLDTSVTIIPPDGTKMDLTFALTENNDLWKCKSGGFMAGWRKAISTFCSCCDNFPAQ